MAREQQHDALAGAFAELQQRSEKESIGSEDYAEKLKRLMEEEAAVAAAEVKTASVTPWQEPDLEAPVIIEPVVEKKSKKHKTAAVEELPAVPKKMKRCPPQRGEKHKSENVRMRVLSEQRTDKPPVAHKTKARDRILEIERQEFFAARVEALVLEAAVKGAPRAQQEDRESMDDIYKASSSLPLRTGSDKLAILFCNQLLASAFEHVGSSSSAASVTRVDRGRDLLKPPKTLEDAMLESENTTVARTSTADLYLMMKRACPTEGVSMPHCDAPKALSPLEQIELDRIRSLQKARSEFRDADHQLEAENQEPQFVAAAEQQELDVLMGNFRTPVVANSGKAIYDRFVDSMLADSSEAKGITAFIAGTDLETCVNLRCIAKAEKELCQMRATEKHKKNEDDGGVAAGNSTRGRVPDPLYSV